MLCVLDGSGVLPSFCRRCWSLPPTLESAAFARDPQGTKQLRRDFQHAREISFCFLSSNEKLRIREEEWTALAITGCPTELTYICVKLYSCYSRYLVFLLIGGLGDTSWRLENLPSLLFFLPITAMTMSTIVVYLLADTTWMIVVNHCRMSWGRPPARGILTHCPIMLHKA